MSNNSASPVPCRSQAARTAEMRERLCDVTLELLGEVGYDRISMTMVADRVGVSRGAQTYHFPTRVDLLVAAFEHLLADWRTVYTDLHAASPGPITPEVFIRYLWRNIHSKPTYIAGLELMLAARGDTELRTRLQAVLAQWSKTCDRKLPEILGLDEDDRRNGIFIQLTNCVLLGMAVQASVHEDASADEELLEAWIAVAHLVARKALTVRSGSPRKKSATASRSPRVRLH